MKVLAVKSLRGLRVDMPKTRPCASYRYLVLQCCKIGSPLAALSLHSLRLAPPDTGLRKGYSLASICLVCPRSATGDLRAESITESRWRANSMLSLPTKQTCRHTVGWKSVLLLHTGCYSATCETSIPGPRCGSKPGSKPHPVEQGATLPAWLPLHRL